MSLGDKSYDISHTIQKITQNNETPLDLETKLAVSDLNKIMTNKQKKYYHLTLNKTQK